MTSPPQHTKLWWSLTSSQRGSALEDMLARITEFHRASTGSISHWWNWCSCSCTQSESHPHTNLNNHIMLPELLWLGYNLEACSLLTLRLYQTLKRFLFTQGGSFPSQAHIACNTPFAFETRPRVLFPRVLLQWGLTLLTLIQYHTGLIQIHNS